MSMSGFIVLCSEDLVLVPTVIVVGALVTDGSGVFEPVATGVLSWAWSAVSRS